MTASSCHPLLARRLSPGERLARVAEAQLAAASKKIAARLDARDGAGWTVRELLEEFERLRAQVERG